MCKQQALNPAVSECIFKALPEGVCERELVCVCVAWILPTSDSAGPEQQW